MTALPKPGSPVTRRLRVNSNGWIVLETRSPGCINSGVAHDLSYHLEYKSTAGWVKVHGTYDNDRDARAARGAANRKITWRLVASNEHGSVALPPSWRGFVR